MAAGHRHQQSASTLPSDLYFFFFSTSHSKIIEHSKEKGSIFYSHNSHSGLRWKEQNERLSAQENSSLKQSAKTEIISLQQTGIAVNQREAISNGAFLEISISKGKARRQAVAWWSKTWGEKIELGSGGIPFSVFPEEKYWSFDRPKANPRQKVKCSEFM